MHRRENVCVLSFSLFSSSSSSPFCRESPRGARTPRRTAEMDLRCRRRRRRTRGFALRTAPRQQSRFLLTARAAFSRDRPVIQPSASPARQVSRSTFTSLGAFLSAKRRQHPASHLHALLRKIIGSAVDRLRILARVLTTKEEGSSFFLFFHGNGIHACASQRFLIDALVKINWLLSNPHVWNR